MNAQELIEEARKVSGIPDIEDVADAIEAFYGNGIYDEIALFEGNEPESIVRIENWLLFTDSQGFTDVEECASIQEAEELLTKFARADQYANGEWF